MTREERGDVLKALAVLGEYHKDELSEARQLIYLEALDRFPYGVVLQALQHSVEIHTFMPKIPELLELIRGNTDDQAELAWHELHAEISRIGSWTGERTAIRVDGQVREVGLSRQPKLSPATRETMLSLFGSWQRACALIGRATESELLGWAKRWKDGYRAIAAQGERRELIGREDAKKLYASIVQRTERKLKAVK